MNIEIQISLVEEILGEWKNVIGRDYSGYKNHVYRMLHFCFAQYDFSEVEREKIIVAGCFHDLGIWTNGTFDYLPPSIAKAQDYLRKNQLESWIPDISLMIDQHHKLTEYGDDKNVLIEHFRRGDLVDFSLGLVPCGVPRNFIKRVKQQFPNAGFHKCLARVAGSWIYQHPLNPAPVLKL